CWFVRWRPGWATAGAAVRIRNSRTRTYVVVGLLGMPVVSVRQYTDCRSYCSVGDDHDDVFFRSAGVREYDILFAFFAIRFHSGGFSNRCGGQVGVGHRGATGCEYDSEKGSYGYGVLFHGESYECLMLTV